MNKNLSATFKTKIMGILSRACILFAKFGWKIRRPVVFCYHGVGDDNNLFTVCEAEFKKQLKMLKQLGEVVTVNNLLKNAKLSDDLISITFDDGLKSVYTKAFPIMKKLGINGCVFVNGDHVLGFGQEDYMSIDELKVLKKSGWEIGYHSWSHKNMKKLSKEELKKEMRMGRIDIEKYIGSNIDYFAYPFGIYDEGIKMKVKRFGYKRAFTVDGKSARSGDNFNVSRVMVDSTMNNGVLLALTTNLGLFINRIFVWIFRIKDDVYSLLSNKKAEGYAKL